MKTLTLKSGIIAALTLPLLTACGGEGGDAPKGTGTTESVPASVSSPQATPSASPTATPSPSPSPSPAASPSPSPYTYAGGSGTSGDPYILAVASDVQHIADHPSSYFQMNQSIAMGSITFKPISNFSGTLYGNNFELDNLTIAETGSSVAALFQNLSGTIVNLKLYAVNISGQGFSSGFAGTLTGLVSHCSITGTITSPSGGNGYNIGTGNPSYVTKTGAGSIVTTTQNVQFNGFTVNNSF